MKNIKIILFLALIIILSFSTYGQADNQIATKIAFKKLPNKVRKQVKSLEGYEITKTTYTIENNKKVYIVHIKNGKSEHDLKLDENGNILGREEDYQ
ncbi:MAG: hypothetical protein L3J08_05215 [Flavobacteriaceae bacterium]|nr:hypothetical protein [Flavobacteriaceae bacterium]